MNKIEFELNGDYIYKKEIVYIEANVFPIAKKRSSNGQENIYRSI